MRELGGIDSPVQAMSGIIASGGEVTSACTVSEHTVGENHSNAFKETSR